jgi:hypothetical protein
MYYIHHARQPFARIHEYQISMQADPSKLKEKQITSPPSTKVEDIRNWKPKSESIVMPTRSEVHHVKLLNPAAYELCVLCFVGILTYVSHVLPSGIAS